MKIKEVFDQLTHGELSQLGIGGAANGGIATENYSKVISHINLGLTALYKRFPLKEGRVEIELQAGRTTYPVTADYAANNRRSRQPVKYIKDSLAEPFINDILKIERVYTSVGHEMGLNDESDVYSVFTPSATVLRVPAVVVAGSVDLPDELKTETLEVVYRANHPVIVFDPDGFEPEEVEIELPYSHLEPLLLFVASRVHTPTGMTNEANLGNTYFAKYEASCQQLETTNLRVDQGSQNTRLARNGWV
jgi:hypothetical protein